MWWCRYQVAKSLDNSSKLWWREAQVLAVKQFFPLCGLETGRHKTKPSPPWKIPCPCWPAAFEQRPLARDSSYLATWQYWGGILHAVTNQRRLLDGPMCWNPNTIFSRSSVHAEACTPAKHKHDHFCMDSHVENRRTPCSAMLSRSWSDMACPRLSRTRTREAVPEKNLLLRGWHDFEEKHFYSACKEIVKIVVVPLHLHNTCWWLRGCHGALRIYRILAF